MQEEDKISIADKIIFVTNSISETPSNDIRDQLILFINDLINKDFNALVQLLYRIDIDEKKLKEYLKQNKNEHSALIITELIIDRQLQKIAFKKGDNKKQKIDPEDSW